MRAIKNIPLELAWCYVDSAVNRWGKSADITNIKEGRCSVTIKTPKGSSYIEEMSRRAKNHFIEAHNRYDRTSGPESLKMLACVSFLDGQKAYELKLKIEKELGSVI